MYTIKNIKTGEKLDGRAKDLGRKIGYTPTGFCRCYKNKLLLKHEWEIINKYEGYVKDGKSKDTHMYDYLDEKNLRHLDKKKVVALHQAYTSGRTDYWTNQRIAEECGVPIKVIEKVLATV